MRAGIKSEHWLDENGKPAGGVAFGNGFAISWQNGPLGRGSERREPNGAFVEDVIAAALDRLNWYQQSEFNSPLNQEAIEHLIGALSVLDQRTREREQRQVEGTHAQ